MVCCSVCIGKDREITVEEWTCGCEAVWEERVGMWVFVEVWVAGGVVSVCLSVCLFVCVFNCATPPVEALKAIVSIAASHKETFSIMHIDVSRAYFHAKAQRPGLIRLPVEDRMGTDAGKVGLMKKSRYGTRDAASNWERDWQGNVKKWGFQLGLSSKNLFHHKEDRVSGLTHRDDFVITGPTNKPVEFDRKMTSVYQSENHQLWIAEEH